MITIRLQGGCANQMFQYAAGLVQARRFKTELQLDVTSFKNDRMREYNLCLFPRITDKVVTDSIVTIHENGMPYNQTIVDSIKDGDVLSGYWQTEKYFKYGFIDIAWNLRDKFQPKPLDLLHRKWFYRILDSKNSTFLTIRRTDYVNNEFHGELPLSYYEEALKIIEQKTGKPDVFVFSDEPDWCRDNLKLSLPFHVAGTYDRTVKGHVGREDADLFLMSMCKNAILANSSFSWWGAWLSDHVRDEGVVIGPKKWFGASCNEDSRDIMCERWIKI